MLKIKSGLFTNTSVIVLAVRCKLPTLPDQQVCCNLWMCHLVLGTLCHHRLHHCLPLTPTGNNTVPVFVHKLTQVGPCSDKSDAVALSVVMISDRGSDFDGAFNSAVPLCLGVK